MTARKTSSTNSANSISSKGCLYIPEEVEYFKADANLAQAMHQLVMGHHQSLLVIRGAT
jgi:hypothetical protein